MQQDRIEFTPRTCESIKNCGHIIFMVNNGVHFNYITTNIQGYNNNILKCLGLDEIEVHLNLNRNLNQNRNEDVKKLMVILNLNQKHKNY